MKKEHTKRLAVCAIMIALATVLSELLKLFDSPFGGGVTLFSMVPIIAIGLALITYTIMKVVTGKAKEVSALTYVLSLIFLIKFFLVA